MQNSQFIAIIVHVVFAVIIIAIMSMFSRDGFAK